MRQIHNFLDKFSFPTISCFVLHEESANIIPFSIIKTKKNRILHVSSSKNCEFCSDLSVHVNPFDFDSLKSLTTKISNECSSWSDFCIFFNDFDELLLAFPNLDNTVHFRNIFSFFLNLTKVLPDSCIIINFYTIYGSTGDLVAGSKIIAQGLESLCSAYFSIDVSNLNNENVSDQNLITYQCYYWFRRSYSKAAIGYSNKFSSTSVNESFLIQVNPITLQLHFIKSPEACETNKNLPSTTHSTPDSTFSLTLSDSELKARSAVVLPYKATSNEELSKIIYEPDKYDDFDEEDPDADLEI